MPYTIQFEITKTNDTELLDAMNWFVTNYPSEIVNGVAQSQTKIFKGILNVVDYTAGVTAIQNLKSQFGTDLTLYDFYYNQ